MVIEPFVKASSVVNEISDDEVTLLIDKEFVGVTEENAGAVVSITNALFAPREPGVPGEGSVSVALLLDPSWIVAPFKAREFVAI
jgi:hypothetical protein